MNRFIILLCSLITIPVFVSAQQTGGIRATLTDGSNGEPIPGAVIELSPRSDTTSKKYYTSIYAGAINIPDIPYGSYRIKVTFLGYENVIQGVNINKPTVNLGKISMSQSSKVIDTVIAETQAMRTSQKGDTLIYNANAFKVGKDADTEALLSKMPGIKIIDGQVEAQGETVKKVFVDGKEFFGQDVNAAIKNLPAEVVSKIEVYDKLSDQAQLTGTDDGEGFKAINIITTISSGQFGKMYAGYGIDDKYTSGANVNVFSGDSRVSIMAMANNINQQNFSMEDILGAVSGDQSGMRSGGGGMRMSGGAQNFMVTQQDGISTVQSIGVNFSDKWGKKTDFSGDYFFNDSKTENHQKTYRQYTNQPAIYNFYRDPERHNSEHRFNGRLNVKFNNNHSLMWRPSISFQNYRSENVGAGERFDISGTDPLLKYRDSTNTIGHNWGYNFSNSLTYRIKLGKPGRSLSTTLSGGIRDNDRKNFTYNLVEQSNSSSTLKKTKRITDSKSYNFNGNVMYTEPLSKYAQINAQYRAQYRYSDSDVKLYQWDPVTSEYDPDFDPTRSSIYNSGYLTQSIGPGFTHSKNRNTIIANVSYQRAMLSKDQEFSDLGEGSSKYTFNNLVYFAMVNKRFNPSTSLRIRARASTNNPSAAQLQETINDTNQTLKSSGNSKLNPSYSHNMFAHFVKSNVTKGRTLMLMTGLTMTNNYITDSVAVNTSTAPITLPNGVILEDGQQFTKPVNKDGNWQIYSNISYGFPVNPIKSNINLNLGVSYNEAPSMVNGITNLRKGQYYNGGIVVGSNISENIDFTINYNGGYNIVNNPYAQSIDPKSKSNNEYFSHAASLRFKWVAWAGFTLSGNMIYSQYRGVTDNYNEEFMNCNLYVGKKIFKNKRGEFIFGVNDLFDQKSSYVRNVTNDRIDDIKNSVIGRYFVFQFVYNLRSFGKRPAGQSGGDSLHSPASRPMMMRSPSGAGSPHR